MLHCVDATSRNHLRSNIRPGLLHRPADRGYSAQVDGRCSRSSNRRRSSEHPCLGSSSFPKRKSTRNHHVRHGQRLGSSSSNGSRVLVCQAQSGRVIESGSRVHPHPTARSSIEQNSRLQICMPTQAKVAGSNPAGRAILGATDSPGGSPSGFFYGRNTQKFHSLLSGQIWTLGQN